MSKALVTLARAKEHLRLDDDDQDVLIGAYNEAAGTAIIGYVGDSAAPWLDSAGDVIADSAGPTDVPADVQAAALLLIATFFTDRVGEAGPNAVKWSGFDLPSAVAALLHRYRLPTLA